MAEWRNSASCLLGWAQRYASVHDSAYDSVHNSVHDSVHGRLTPAAVTCVADLNCRCVQMLRHPCCQG